MPTSDKREPQRNTTEKMMATDLGKPLAERSDDGVDAQIRSVPLPGTRIGETGAPGTDESALDDDEQDLADERRRLEEDSDAQAAQDPAKIPRPRD
jgi:hypothetical protein